MDLLISHEIRYIAQNTNVNRWIPYEDRSALLKIGPQQIYLTYGKTERRVGVEKMIVRPDDLTCQNSERMSVIKWKM